MADGKFMALARFPVGAWMFQALLPAKPGKTPDNPRFAMTELMKLERAATLWTEGVRGGQISEQLFVAVLSTNQARVHGLVGRKGAIAPGNDADIVIWDPDMTINVTREKQKSNIRTHSHDDAIKLAPARLLTLETAIEFIAEDELVEVTPKALRVRKRVLREQDRRRITKK